MEFLKKLINSNLIFGIFIASFIIGSGIAAVERGGRDLKVDLFGAQQVLQKKSPYDNPTDPPRPLFRYAPLFALMMQPFLMQSESQAAAFEYKNMTNSIISFYITKICLLYIIVFLLFKMIPSFSIVRAFRNFKIAFLFSLPFIAYELTNNQNKLIAIFFLIFSLFLFERQRLWLSGIFFNLALVVYLPLVLFIIYFLKYRKKFIITFIITSILIFIILPSFFIGVNYNNYLLKEWFIRTLKPFFVTNSYSSYIDLRRSSQSLPSAIGRIFVTAKTGTFKYAIPPFYIHIIIKFFSVLISLLSFFVIWFSTDKTKGLQFSILLILALILPQYCIYYTWAYLLVIYFCIFNYIDEPQVDKYSKMSLLILSILVFVSICLIVIPATKYLSILFWSTLALWVGMVCAIFKQSSFKRT